jgi:hypothetical protein
LSDKDIELQITRIGAQAQDPVAFRAVLADVERSLTGSFQRTIDTATGMSSAAPTPGPAARTGLTPAQIEGMTGSQLKAANINIQALDADQRKALDRALKRLGK